MLIAEKDPASGKNKFNTVGLSIWLIRVKQSPIWSKPKKTSSSPLSIPSASRSDGDILAFTITDHKLIDGLFSYMTKHYVLGNDKSGVQSDQQPNQDASEKVQESTGSPVRRSSRLKGKAEKVGDKEDKHSQPTMIPKPKPTSKSESNSEPKTKKPGDNKSGIKVEKMQRKWFNFSDNEPMSGLQDYED